MVAADAAATESVSPVIGAASIIDAHGTVSPANRVEWERGKVLAGTVGNMLLRNRTLPAHLVCQSARYYRSSEGVRTQCNLSSPGDRSPSGQSLSFPFSPFLSGSVCLLWNWRRIQFDEARRTHSRQSVNRHCRNHWGELLLTEAHTHIHTFSSGDSGRAIWSEMKTNQRKWTDQLLIAFSELDALQSWQSKQNTLVISYTRQL